MLKLVLQGLECFVRAMQDSAVQGSNSTGAYASQLFDSVSYAKSILERGSMSEVPDNAADLSLVQTPGSPEAMSVCFASAEAATELSALRLLQWFASGPEADAFLDPSLHRSLAGISEERLAQLEAVV